MAADRTFAPLQATYCCVEAASVRDFKVLAEPPVQLADAPEPPALPPANVELARSREERALKKAQEDAEQINQKATMRGQTIFNALNKTMKCEWVEKADVQAILVMGGVLVQPPYTPETMIGDKRDERLVERVRKVLAGILCKLDAVPLK